MRTANRRRAAPRDGWANGGESPSPPSLKLGRHEQQRERLLAALGAAHGLHHLGRDLRSERVLDDILRINPADHAFRKIVGDVEPPPDAVDPGSLVVRKALWRRRTPQRFTEQPLSIREPLSVRFRHPACPPHPPT